MVMTLPFRLISSTINSSSFLSESTIIALDAVKVPATWSNISPKYCPPITLTLEPSPMNNLSPRLPCVPVPCVYANSPFASELGAEVPVDLLICNVTDIVYSLEISTI